MKMEQTECSETSAYQIQTPGNYPEENIQHTEHGESFKSRIQLILLRYFLDTATQFIFTLCHMQGIQSCIQLILKMFGLTTVQEIQATDVPNISETDQW